MYYFGGFIMKMLKKVIHYAALATLITSPLCAGKKNRVHEDTPAVLMTDAANRIEEIIAEFVAHAHDAEQPSQKTICKSLEQEGFSVEQIILLGMKAGENEIHSLAAACADIVHHIFQTTKPAELSNDDEVNQSAPHKHDDSNIQKFIAEIYPFIYQNELDLAQICQLITEHLTFKDIKLLATRAQELNLGLLLTACNAIINDTVPVAAPQLMAVLEAHDNTLFVPNHQAASSSADYSSHNHPAAMTTEYGTDYETGSDKDGYNPDSEGSEPNKLQTIIATLQNLAANGEEPDVENVMLYILDQKLSPQEIMDLYVYAQENNMNTLAAVCETLIEAQQPVLMEPYSNSDDNSTLVSSNTRTQELKSNRRHTPSPITALLESDDDDYIKAIFIEFLKHAHDDPLPSNKQIETWITEELFLSEDQIHQLIHTITTYNPKDDEEITILDSVLVICNALTGLTPTPSVSPEADEAIQSHGVSQDDFNAYFLHSGAF
jgi:hypothetical protein